MKIDVTTNDRQQQQVELELIPGQGIFIEYQNGNGRWEGREADSLYYRWEDLSGDIQEKLQKLNDNFSKQIKEAFSILSP